jgi:MYXO-CTERM domain-containing protein
MLYLAPNTQKERHQMRRSVVIGTTTLTLLFGGAGVANATELTAPAPTTTTTVAQEAEDDGGNAGLWGLAGLLGLLGLAGLARRKGADYPATRGTTGPANPPRV